MEIAYAPKCKTELDKPPATWMAGNILEILVQMRDAFGNPLQTPLSVGPTIISQTIPPTNDIDVGGEEQSAPKHYLNFTSECRSLEYV